LVNGTRNQTRNIGFLSKYVWEGAGEGRSCLNGWEGVFANVVSFSKSKDMLHLICCHRLFNPHNVGVHVSKYLKKKKEDERRRKQGGSERREWE
jgi:hypothetical protein